MAFACTSFEENSLIRNGICVKCYKHENLHQTTDPYYKEKSLRTQIEDILYYATNELPEEINPFISRLLLNLPPAQIYYKIFNVFSYVCRNLTNPQFTGMKLEEKLIAIFQGVDFLLLIALSLRRPPSFEKVSKLRRTIPDMRKAEILDGTIDVINKLGYTVVTRDHFEFPQEIQEAPDQTLIREIIADLTIAMTEIKYYHDKRHPNPERFTERSEWAKKTTPILTDLDDKRPLDPSTPLKKNQFIIPSTGPIDSTLILPSYQLPVTNRPPPPSPGDTIECPRCLKVFPKKTPVCPECRKCLPQVKPNIELIPLEEWLCKTCTMKNSTARGRTRVCCACGRTDDISGHISTPSNQPSQDTPPYKPDSMGPIRRPSMNPLRDPSMNPDGHPSLNPRISTLNPESTYIHRSDRSMNQPLPPVVESGHFGVSQGPPLNQPTNPDVIMGDYHNDPYTFPNSSIRSYVETQPPHLYYDPISYTPGRSQIDPRMPISLYQPPSQQAPHKRVKHILSQNTGFKDESLQLAIKKCGISGCLGWLKSEFREIIGILSVDVQGYPLCQTVTSQGVEESYLACQGDMANVLLNIQQSRITKLDELVASFKVDQKIAISRLDDANWEISAASENMVLTNNQRQIDSYRSQLWGGGMTIPEVDTPGEDVDTTLWQELNLFASEEKEMDAKIVRKFLCELKVPSFLQLNLLLQLLRSEETKEKQPKELLQAVNEISEFDAAIKFLNQECSICMNDYTANDMIQMFYCDHSACKACITDYFTNVIRGAAIKKWVCFECGEPDISQMDDPSDYFALLSNVIQEMCGQEVSTLFHQKVNEFYLSKRTEFRWCPHCHSGFMGLENEIKLRCPQEECQQYMCYICKNKWHAEHEGKSCEEFQQWREENDRDILDKGLAAKMVEEGIECPSCKFKYELARGGCMHFRCTQCPAEFCSGCFQLFKKENCTKFPSCAKKGLHAHHPRNCQYFTRDMDIVKMKELLEFGGFKSDAAVLEAPPPADGAPVNPAKKQQIYKIRVPDEHRNRVINELTVKMGAAFAEPPPGELKIPCQIVEYKESPDGGFEKEDCSKSSYEKEGYAGLCDKHYKEYLCGLITKAGLDPIDVLQVTEDNIFELFAVLRRNEIPFDDKMKGDALKLLIKEKLPLQPMKFKGALQA